MIFDSKEIKEALQFAEKNSGYQTSECKKAIDQITGAASPLPDMEVTKQLGLSVRTWAKAGKFLELVYLCSILLYADKRDFLNQILFAVGPETGRGVLDYIFKGVSDFEKKYPFKEKQPDHFTSDIPEEYADNNNQFLNFLVLFLLCINFSNIPLHSTTDDLLKNKNSLSSALFSFYSLIRKIKEYYLGDRYINKTFFHLINTNVGKGEKDFTDIIGNCRRLSSAIAAMAAIYKDIENNVKDFFNEKAKKNQPVRLGILACGMAQELIPYAMLADQYKVKLIIEGFDTNNTFIEFNNFAFNAGDSEPELQEHTIKFSQEDINELSPVNKYDIISLGHPDFAEMSNLKETITSVIPKITSLNALVIITVFWRKEASLLIEILKSCKSLLNPNIKLPTSRQLAFFIHETDSGPRFHPANSFQITLTNMPTLTMQAQMPAKRKPQAPGSS